MKIYFFNILSNNFQSNTLESLDSVLYNENIFFYILSNNFQSNTLESLDSVLHNENIF